MKPKWIFTGSQGPRAPCLTQPRKEAMVIIIFIMSFINHICPVQIGGHCE